MPALASHFAQRAAVLAVALGAVLSGCGDSPPSGDGAVATSGSGVVRAGAPGAITVESGNAVPLGISPAQVMRRLGEPAVALRRKSTRHRCMFYDLVGQPPTVQLQYCFAGAKLDVVATYISDR